MLSLPATLADALIEAHRLHDAGDNDQARVLLLAIVEQSPAPVVSALMLLGRIARIEGRAGEAADWLAAAVEAAPDQPLPRVALAELALARGLAEDAEDMLREALRLDRACAPALIGLGLAQLARGRRDEAEASFRAATQAEPGSAAAHFHLGNALLAGNAPDRAEASLRRALRLESNDADIAAALALALRAQGQDDDALAFAQRAASGGEPGHLAALGDLLAVLGRTAEAEAAFRRALDSAPDHVAAHEGLARLLLAAHDPRAAAAGFRRALALAPEAWPLELALGRALRLAGEIEAARASFGRVDRPEAVVQMALSDLLEGRLAEGWATLAEQWRAGVLDFSPLAPPGPRWEGTALPDHALLVDCGLDATTTITLMRLLPLARARVGRLVVVCRPDLRRLLAALPGVDCAVSEGEIPGGYAAHAAIETLPALLALVSPPPAPPVPVARSDWQFWRDRLATGPRVGIVRHGTGHALGPAFALPDLSIDGIDLDAGRFRDFAELAAALAHLDAVIGADSPALRLAATLGVPCLAIIPPVGDWPWGWRGDGSEWFPSARIWRWKAGDEARVRAEFTRLAQGLVPQFS